MNLEGNIDAFNAGGMSLAQLSKNYVSENMTGAFCQFLDDFARSSDKEAMISDEPIWSDGIGDWIYSFAACAHKLACDNGISVPNWALKDKYVSPHPLYAFGTKNPEFQAYLRETTPYEYRAHNLFYGENVCKRA